jgi:hypothetical protein
VASRRRSAALRCKRRCPAWKRSCCCRARWACTPRSAPKKQRRVAHAPCMLARAARCGSAAAVHALRLHPQP